MASIPAETFTSVHCLRDAAQGECSVDVLLPEHVKFHEKSRPISAECEQIRQHPLAAHVPLWYAHVLRLVHATAELARLFPGEWGEQGWSVDQVLASDAVRELWEQTQAIQGSETAKLRASLRIAKGGTSRAVIAPLASPKGATLMVRLDPTPTSLQGPTTYLKTDCRKVYDDARARVRGNLGALNDTTHDPCFDVLLWSDVDGTPSVTESSIANIILEVPNASPSLVTPPFQNLLPGMLIQELVRQEKVSQRALSVEDIRDALQNQNGRLYLCNAVRGMFQVLLG